MVSFFERIPLWLRFLLKACLVMLIPLSFTMTSIADIPYLPFGGFLFTTWNPYIYYAYEYSAYLPSISVSDLSTNFALGLLLAAPAIYFNYRIVNSPANKPIRNFAFAIMVFSSFVMFFALMIVTSTGTLYYINYMLLQNIQIFPTLTICFFVILPMIQRQAVLIATPEELQSNTVRELEKHPELELRREKALATLLWACLCFLPYFAMAYGSLFYSDYSVFYSFVYLINNGYSYYDFYSILNLYGSVVPYYALPIFAILSSFRFIYVRDIYRFLKHELTYRRMLYIGILGDIFPVISFAFLNMVLFGYSPYYGVYPIPLLAFAGLLIARLHRSVLPHANRIWQDVDARMWFEEQVVHVPVQQVPEKPYRSPEETITVPIRYLLTSQIRKRFRNHRNGDSHKD
jgi:hypothetical protein